MKPEQIRAMPSIDIGERRFYCALGPTEILATAYAVAKPLIWESYELDEADPVIGEWPFPGDTDKEILEKLNDDICDCWATDHSVAGAGGTPRRPWPPGAHPKRYSESPNRGTMNFTTVKFVPDMNASSTAAVAIIRCRQCGAEATIRLLLAKRWYDGQEEDAIVFD